MIDFVFYDSKHLLKVRNSEMIRSVKVRLKPNNKQLTKLFQYSDCARFAYNWAIARERQL